MSSRRFSTTDHFAEIPNFFCCIGVKKGCFLSAMVFFGYGLTKLSSLLTGSDIAPGYYTVCTVQITCIVSASFFLFIGSIIENTASLCLFMVFGGSELVLHLLDLVFVSNLSRTYTYELLYDAGMHVCIFYLMIVIPFYMTMITRKMYVLTTLNQALTEGLNLSMKVSNI